MFEELDDTELALGRRVLRAIGWRVGMVTVWVDDSGQLPGPAVDDVTWDAGGALPDVRSPWTQRALLDAVREAYGDGLIRIEPTGRRYVVVGFSGTLPYPDDGWESPERALVAALDPDGEPGLPRHVPPET